MRNQKGIIIVLVLVYGTIFLLLLGGISGFVLLQHRFTIERASWEKSLHIAEAGIHFARWRLAHAPTNFGFSGIYDFKNTAGIIIGQYQLEIIAPTACSPRTTIKSTAWTLKHPEIKRTIQVFHLRSNLARYAFLTNSSIWFGPGEKIRGMAHSNIGIRMDGVQNAIFSSARETYTCGPEHGCSPPQEKPGIWGDGTGGAIGLWNFPVPHKDFNAVIHDLNFLRQEARLKGIFLDPSPLRLGYYLRFRDNATVDIFQVKSLKPAVWGFNGERWVFESNDFDTTKFLGNFLLPANCAPIFIKDNVWISGTINGRVVLAAARLPKRAMAEKRTKIIISDNIIRANPESVLSLIARDNILIPLYIPAILRIEAVLLAQRGSIIRYFYPFWHTPYNIRDRIEVFGSVISNGIWTFTWVDRENRVISGFKETETNHDVNLIHNPPPYFPVYGKYQIKGWREL
jgi:hypothetical protein